VQLQEFQHLGQLVWFEYFRGFKELEHIHKFLPLEHVSRL
jgi:hypothetical protein